MSEEEKINQSRADSQQTEENKTVEQPLTINNEPITNMEVHHHPRVEKKNFKEYFLEFLMIFLAVTMGFFAENIRENISDSKQEHEYAQSMINDLKSDVITYKTNDSINTTDCNTIDTIFTLLKTNTNN